MWRISLHCQCVQKVMSLASPLCLGLGSVHSSFVCKHSLDLFGGSCVPQVPPAHRFPRSQISRLPIPRLSPFQMASSMQHHHITPSPNCFALWITELISQPLNHSSFTLPPICPLHTHYPPTNKDCVNTHSCKARHECGESAKDVAGHHEFVGHWHLDLF